MCQVLAGTTVTWVNEDNVPHNIQSQDEFGKVTDVFNSPPLNTGERFEFTFEEEGVYNYYCSFHPWRVGLVTVK
jgi:plastocyanin